jgi:hypothetical protein
LLELREDDYRPSWERTLNYWFEGRREAWWVIEEHGTLCGAVRALRERGRRPDRLEVLIAPGYSGRFETVLVQQGMISLRGTFRKMIGIILPCSAESLVMVLEAAGFRRSRVLAQMQLDLA